jgi:hypothetical protein
MPPSFTRHLDPEFIDALNRLRDDRNSWWRKLVDDRDVFIAIRNNWINAYCSGASLARIGWNGTLQFRAHRAYLVFPAKADADPYVDLLRKGNRLSVTAVDNETKFVSEFHHIKKGARRLQGLERTGENAIAVACPTVLDIEAAFNSDIETASQDGDGVGSGRVDLVAANGNGQLTLVEAKLYKNAEIRSKGTPPIVCAQLRQYYDWATSERSVIVEAYRTVHEYRRMLRLRPWADLANDARSPDVAPCDLDPIPRLLIYEFDRAQQKQFDQLRTGIIDGSTIPGFTGKHIRTLGSPRSVRDTHLC